MITGEVSIEQVIARRRARVMTRAGYRSLLFRVVYIGLIAYILLTYCFLITQCQGQGMYPALKDGDLCVVFRRQTQELFREKLAQDDIVAYQVKGKRYFGRIVAAAGDVVIMDDGGSLSVNGVTEGGEILFPTYATNDLEYPYLVPEGCVFVMGDHRTSTTDSRVLGPIPLSDVEGKLITILRRREI